MSNSTSSPPGTTHISEFYGIITYYSLRRRDYFFDYEPRTVYEWWFWHEGDQDWKKDSFVNSRNFQEVPKVVYS